MYAKLDYFSTECVYSPNACRGHARTFLIDLERIRPTSIIDIIHSGLEFIISDSRILHIKAEDIPHNKADPKASLNLIHCILESVP